MAGAVCIHPVAPSVLEPASGGLHGAAGGSAGDGGRAGAAGRVWGGAAGWCVGGPGAVVCGWNHGGALAGRRGAGCSPGRNI